MTKKTKKEETCCEKPPVWAALFVIIGAVWLVEHYTRLDVPLVAILLVVVGLYYLIKNKV